MRALLAFALLLIAAPAAAQTFPALTGRVVDQANLIPDDQEAALTQRLEALEQASSRQLVVTTVNSLEGYEIEEYGYKLGRHWRIGQEGANNGLLLLVAPNERKVRIEVGYGLEGIVTDALSRRIIDDTILPRFRADDYPGGIIAGADAIIAQLQAPPEVAEQRALEAARAGDSGDRFAQVFALVFVVFCVGVIVAGFIFVGRPGKTYRGRRGRGGPVLIWGPTLDDRHRSSGWSSGGWSSGGSSWSGGGGFSGGGGSFGGGGASGGW